MRVLNIETVTHGRVLVDDAVVSGPGAERRRRRWLVGFHGYGQAADDIFAELQHLNAGGTWSIAAPQALHRFYTRGDERVVANWMTRQDREDAVADNVEYVNTLLESICGADRDEVRLVFVGFSQGAAMAYRAAVLGRFRGRAVVALAGDIPPEVRQTDPETVHERLPRVLIGVGSRDSWYASKADADTAFLRSCGVAHEVVRFEGGHEWTEEFRNAVRRALRSPSGDV
jgi:predicted esterase